MRIRRENHKFQAPFHSGGCCPLAWAYVSGDWRSAKAEEIADRMARLPGRLYSKRSGAAYALERHVSKWAEVAGVEIVETIKFRRPGITAAQFLRDYGYSGRWVFVSRYHAMSAIDGEPMGFTQSRARVYYAWRVRPLASVETEERQQVGQLSLF